MAFSQELYQETTLKFLLMKNKYTHPQEIPEGNYVGYIWEADEKRPRILPDEEYSKDKWGKNSYIIEGLLYDKGQKKSIHIRHTGRYVIHQFDLEKLPEGGELKTVEYLSHRLGEKRPVYFQQLWLPENDENCHGMEVLKMKALIFIGFDNPKIIQNA